jgi:hypothetical protein
MNSSILKAAGSDAAMKLFLQKLDAFLQGRNVSTMTRNRIIAIVTHAQEYVDLCQKMGRNPSDKRALTVFLMQKGIFIAHMSQDESAECYASVAGFAIDAFTKAEFSLGRPPGAALYASFMVLDILEMGNSCEFLQAAYYDAFLKQAPTVSARQVMKQSLLRANQSPKP